MHGEDAIRIEGTVIQVLPKKLFWVTLENGHRFLAHLKRKNQPADFVVGDKVTVEMSPFDLSKGRIIQ